MFCPALVFCFILPAQGPPFQLTMKKKFTFYYQDGSAVHTRDIVCSNQGKAIALFTQRYGRHKIVRIVKSKCEPQTDNLQD